MKANREQIIRLLAEKSISAAELSRLSELTTACISKILSGKTSNIAPATAGKLAKALNTDLMEIIIL